jgi:type II secretory pathway component PulF
MKRVVIFMAILAVFMAPTFAQTQENFTLNFPSTGGTVITGNTVAQAQSDTLILLVPIFIGIAIVLGVLRKFEVI